MAPSSPRPGSTGFRPPRCDSKRITFHQKRNKRGENAFVTKAAMARRRAEPLWLRRCFCALPARCDQAKTAKREKRQRAGFRDQTRRNAVTEVGPRIVYQGEAVSGTAFIHVYTCPAILEAGSAIEPKRGESRPLIPPIGYYREGCRVPSLQRCRR